MGVFTHLCVLPRSPRPRHLEAATPFRYRVSQCLPCMTREWLRELPDAMAHLAVVTALFHHAVCRLAAALIAPPGFPPCRNSHANAEIIPAT
ncbi:hypothetical protein DOTSEDRAFT_75843 [Dothistroma septosporum NZE10]|uniref:Uncharacterized protein n=1 Tax=Dothistroma septosporum (strain NZE10 / CBS 128990) TaxID=675120 RepID=N1PBT9_DOTSN|nr:hypothetical protein DOTSEDRAFT_75843 [Dothistroma septosporum NZE10]